ncbi:hypothetical protein [Candidatus Coxiella mudrowiae]|uniref:hypothetical protein n=1 Tax=Candidatus Coxiella mudrowiae TaxID=2054173 RepID=UPI0012FF240C|nr:hypothetical protein [Candidatus Coxiella mudrowiae]
MNSLGYVIAPLLVSGFIASTDLDVLYMIIAGLMILVALFISRFNFNSVNDPLQKEAARGH